MGETAFSSVAMDPRGNALRGGAPGFLSSHPFINDKNGMIAFLEMFSLLTGGSHLHLCLSIINDAIIRPEIWYSAPTGVIGRDTHTPKSAYNVFSTTDHQVLLTFLFPNPLTYD